MTEEKITPQKIMFRRAPNHQISINSPKGKNLILDFNGDKLKISGDLEYCEAAKTFFDSLDGFFKEAIDKQVKLRLAEIEDFKRLANQRFEEFIKKLKDHFQDGNSDENYYENQIGNIKREIDELAGEELV